MVDFNDYKIKINTVESQKSGILQSANCLQCQN